MRPTIAGKDVYPVLSDELKGKINALKPTQVLAVYMRNTSTDDSKVTVEFAEKINLSSQPQNALAMFNPGDDRFSSGARRAWATMDRVYAENMFKVSIPEKEAFAEIGQILNTIENDSQEFRIRLVELPESSFNDAQREYADNYLKRIPSTGAYFIAADTGERVGVVARVVVVNRVYDAATGKWFPGDPQHSLIKGEYKVEGSSYSGAASILQSAGTNPRLVS